jgi:hypothetical protein
LRLVDFLKELLSPLEGLAAKRHAN